MRSSLRCTVALSIAAIWIALAGWGCGGKAAAPARPVSQGEGKARQEARAVLDEIYGALKSGDTDDLLSLMSDDVVVLGPRPADLLRSRAEVVTGLREVLEARKKTRFASQGLRLAIGPGGGSAYAVDRLQLAGRPVIAVALLDGARTIWRVSAVHLQAPLGAAAIQKAAAAGTLGAPAGTAEPRLGEAEGQGDAPARELARQLDKVGSWVAALEGDEEAVVIGADGAVAFGKKAIGRAVKRLADVRLEASSPVAAVVSSDGQLALATCTATRTIEPAEEAASDGKKKGGKSGRGKAKNDKGIAKAAAEEPPRTVRVTAILRREGGGWKLAAFAEAHALAEPAAPTKK